MYELCGNSENFDTRQMCETSLQQLLRLVRQSVENIKCNGGVDANWVKLPLPPPLSFHVP